MATSQTEVQTNLGVPESDGAAAQISAVAFQDQILESKTRTQGKRTYKINKLNVYESSSGDQKWASLATGTWRSAPVPVTTQSPHCAPPNVLWQTPLAWQNPSGRPPPAHQSLPARQTAPAWQNSVAWQNPIVCLGTVVWLGRIH